MKSVFFPLIILALISVSCKKKGCTNSSASNYNSKATKDDGSCVYDTNNPNPTNQTYLFTGSFNFVDRNEILEFKGVTNLVPYENPVAGYMGSGDSIIQLQFKQYNSSRWITIRLETHNGNTIVPGTYDFATPSSIHRVSVTSSSEGDFLHAHSNADPNGILYNGSPIVKTGQLVITEITATKVVGTLSGNIYGDLDLNTGEMQSKMIISNGAFDCALD